MQFVRDRAREVMEANKNLRERPVAGGRVEKQIAWQRPGSGWYKLNTDGAAIGNLGLATAGGVVRGEYRMWEGGFAIKIGICSAPLAELWGIYYGMCIALGSWHSAARGRSRFRKCGGLSSNKDS